MSLNKVILIGNVGRDPEVRHFDNGSVANFSLATSERGFRRADGTEVPERTEWHRIVVNRNQVDFVERHVRKGSLLMVEGKIRSREYLEKDGQTKRTVYEIIADNVRFFDSGFRRTDAQPMQNNNAGAAVEKSVDERIAEIEDGEDDLPF